jgi:hypothetical protein
MKDLFSGQLNHPAGVALPTLNPFAVAFLDARTAIERLIELQQPHGVRGGGNGSYTATG